MGSSRRKKWIRVIRRDSWAPNTTSNYNKVCSKHFKATDFQEEMQRRPIKGVLSSVFEGYPLASPARKNKRKNCQEREQRTLCSDDVQCDCYPPKIQNRADCAQIAQHAKPSPSLLPNSATGDERVSEPIESPSADFGNVEVGRP